MNSPQNTNAFDQEKLGLNLNYDLSKVSKLVYCKRVSELLYDVVEVSVYPNKDVVLWSYCKRVSELLYDVLELSVYPNKDVVLWS